VQGAGVIKVAGLFALAFVLALAIDEIADRWRK
jgi:hypothetical protein